MPIDATNPFGARASLPLGGETAVVYRLSELARQGIADLDRLPFSIRVLLENALRHAGRGFVTDAHVRNLAAWSPRTASRGEVPFMPARVVLQDFTGVPCVVDLAAMRDAMGRMGGDPDRINPLVPCDLVIDHSVQVDSFGSERALELNVELEFERNLERYQLLKLGPAGLRQLPRGPARHRHRPPGEPRVPGARGPAPAAVRRGDRVPRHAGRHRLAHHDDQRPRRRGLGRRRHRGRGGHAGTAATSCSFRRSSG